MINRTNLPQVMKILNHLGLLVQSATAAACGVLCEIGLCGDTPAVWVHPAMLTFGLMLLISLQSDLDSLTDLTRKLSENASRAQDAMKK